MTPLNVPTAHALLDELAATPNRSATTGLAVVTDDDALLEGPVIACSLMRSASHVLLTVGPEPGPGGKSTGGDVQA